MSTREKLNRIYELLEAAFGPQHWWPGESAFEMMVGAVLTQNTSWKNVEKAIANLKARGLLSSEKLRAIAPAELAALIRPAGYYNVKADRVKSFVALVAERFGGDLEAMLGRPAAPLRVDLLGVRGIGPETADSMILYAAGRCTFVVDAYTRRVCRRHGLIGQKADYDAVKGLYESHVPPRVDLYNEYHALLVAVGKHFCRPTARCDDCPLACFPHDASAGL